MAAKGERTERETLEPEVILAERDGLGWITLNRPKAINALTHGMERAITPALRRWAAADAIRAVVLTGAGERGLCAGGDIVAIYHAAKTGDRAEAREAAEFWRAEYELNHAISRFPKPYVAVMDGIVMGGGVGLAAHGSVRVVTERSMVGMPEVGIGFVPDVGGTHLLARAPGLIGRHVALTTARMSGADAIAAGFADHHVPADALPALLDALGVDPVVDAVARFATPAPESELAVQRDWIDDCYAADTPAEIVRRLCAHGDAAARKAAEQILAKSPIAVSVALRSLRAAAETDSLAENLNREFRVSVAALRSHDLVEGIRAQVIDKDRNPRWSPATLDDVTEAQIDTYFEDLGDRELGLRDVTVQSEGQS
ncbi:MAG: enoyl-CoA hydratase/isomerase family protein [Mycobacteriaceae bacterium]|nr:enoyl-CoA hydratase/isomerase family protein [Mycobacteriaceae bacterium]